MKTHTSKTPAYKSLFLRFIILSVLFVLALSVNYAFAVVVGPTQAPPGGNTPTPIHVGSTPQVKDGPLSLTGLSVLGGGYFQGNIGIKVPVISGVPQISIGTDASPKGQSLSLDVEGSVGAKYFCDENGNNCVAGNALGSSGTGGTDTGSGWVDITSSTDNFDMDCEYKWTTEANDNTFYATVIADTVLYTDYSGGNYQNVWSNNKALTSGDTGTWAVKTYERCGGTGGGADSDWTISSSGSDMYSGVSGNVGIGVTSPNTKLDVAGNIKASGTICDSNGCIGSGGTGGTGGTDTGSGWVEITNDTNPWNIQCEYKWTLEDASACGSGYENRPTFYPTMVNPNNAIQMDWSAGNVMSIHYSNKGAISSSDVCSAGGAVRTYERCGGVGGGGSVTLGALGDWESRNVDTIYQAATDGFVLGWTYNFGNLRGVSIKNDSFSPPTTVRHKSGSGSTSGTGVYVPFNIPVKKGDYYKAETYGSPDITIFWRPIVSGGTGGGGADSDWTIAGNDMYSGVPGNVGIGVTSPNTKLDVAGGIKIGNTTTANAGVIRWTGTDFEGYNGTEWKSLTAESGTTIISGDATDCANVGGNWIDAQGICYVPGTSCPSNWTAQESYSSTSSNSCTGSVGGLGQLQDIRCQSSCSTSSHTRTNTRRESCTYENGSAYDGAGGCYYGNSGAICNATQTEIGCVKQ